MTAIANSAMMRVDDEERTFLRNVGVELKKSYSQPREGPKDLAVANYCLAGDSSKGPSLLNEDALRAVPPTGPIAVSTIFYYCNTAASAFVFWSYPQFV